GSFPCRGGTWAWPGEGAGAMRAGNYVATFGPNLPKLRPNYVATFVPNVPKMSAIFVATFLPKMTFGRQRVFGFARMAGRLKLWGLPRVARRLTPFAGLSAKVRRELFIFANCARSEGIWAGCAAVF